MKTAVMTLAALAMGGILRAELLSLTPLATQAEGAALIVVGEVTASNSDEAGSSSVQIARVLKGEPGGATVAFRWANELRDFTGTRSVHGMLFLSSEGPGRWVGVPRVAKSVVLTDHLLLTPSGDLSAEYSYGADAPTLEKIAAELSFAVATDSDPDHLAKAFESLLSLESTPGTVATPAMGGALARTVRNRLVKRLPVPSSLSSLLCLTTDPKSVDAAAALVNAAGADRLTRRCAVKALRNVHSTAALPALAAALDDSDMEIVYDAMMGLSAYAIGQMEAGTGREGSRSVDDPTVYAHSPSIPKFNESPPRYLAYWRRWWKCEACRLDEPGCDGAACAR
jgi:hypothetical protein